MMTLIFCEENATKILSGIARVWANETKQPRRNWSRWKIIGKIKETLSCGEGKSTLGQLLTNQIQKISFGESLWPESVTDGWTNRHTEVGAPQRRHFLYVCACVCLCHCQRQWHKGGSILEGMGYTIGYWCHTTLADGNIQRQKINWQTENNSKYLEDPGERSKSSGQSSIYKL